VARVRQAMVSSLDDVNLLVGPQMVENLPRLINGNEFIRFSARHLNNPIIRLIIAPSLALQSLTTRPPDDDMLQVAIAALNRVLEIEGSLAAE